MDGPLHAAGQQLIQAVAALVQPFQMQLKCGQQSLHRILPSHLQAEITEGLSGGQGLQLAAQSGMAVEHPQLAHAGQTTAAADLQFQQGQGCRCRQAALRPTGTRDCQAGHPLRIAEQAEQPIVFAEWPHLQGQPHQGAFGHSGDRSPECLQQFGGAAGAEQGCPGLKQIHGQLGVMNPPGGLDGAAAAAQP